MARVDRRRQRHQAREAALQMLYQREVGRTDLEDVIPAFLSLHAGDATDETRTFAAHLARGTVAHLEAIDPLISAGAEHWRLARMAIMDRLIMRLAVYEFLHGGETPRAVVINEALELARTFSTDEAVKFINGILDGIRKKLDAEKTGDQGSGLGDREPQRRD
jgi:N utilization substance protein B